MALTRAQVIFINPPEGTRQWCLKCEEKVTIVATFPLDTPGYYPAFMRSCDNPACKEHAADLAVQTAILIGGQKI